MSDHYHSLTVVLEKDIKDEDANSLIEAIKQFRGVIDVSTHVSDLTTHMAENRARHEFGQKIIEAIYPDLTPL